MNGSWAKNPVRMMRQRFFRLGLPVLPVLLLAGVGCQNTHTYDGSLAPGYSRLTVSNRTPWSCRVTVIPLDPPQATEPHTTISAVVEAGQNLTWDLLADEYRLTAVAAGGDTFATEYQALPGSHRRWPLVDRGRSGSR